MYVYVLEDKLGFVVGDPYPIYGLKIQIIVLYKMAQPNIYHSLA